jgi:hypothetical protein
VNLQRSTDNRVCPGIPFHFGSRFNPGP